jgi:hypothetical protein
MCAKLQRFFLIFFTSGSRGDKSIVDTTVMYTWLPPQNFFQFFHISKSCNKGDENLDEKEGQR